MSNAPSTLPPETAPSGDHREPYRPRSPHSMGNRIGRIVWGLVYVLLFRYSPRPLHFWRRFLLRLFGAKLGPGVRVYPRAKIWAPWNLTLGRDVGIGDDVDVYCVAALVMGDGSAVSQYSFLCGATHDYRDAGLPLVAMPITIGKDVWIAADVFVAPGVTIADGVVVGARSSVFKDLPAWTVCAGSPAKPVKAREFDAKGR